MIYKIQIKQIGPKIIKLIYVTTFLPNLSYIVLKLGGEIKFIVTTLLTRHYLKFFTLPGHFFFKSNLSYKFK